jgi:hypothetical protein
MPKTHNTIDEYANSGIYKVTKLHVNIPMLDKQDDI